MQSDLPAARQQERLCVTRISKSTLADSILAVSAMSMREKETLADEIHRHQPNLLMAVMAQSRLGAPIERVELLLTILLVCYQAMRCSGLHWPRITEAQQERCVSRLTGPIRFTEGMTTDQRTAAIANVLERHEEPWLLAYVLERLTESGVAAVAHESDKYVILAAVSLVDVIAVAGVEGN